MAQTELIAAIDQALEALKAARKALVANAKLETRSKSTNATTNTTAKLPAGKAPARRGMSEEGKLRIAEAQRKRWALQKKAAKKAARLAARGQ